jgi:hypothetical protein
MPSDRLVFYSHLHAGYRLLEATRLDHFIGIIFSFLLPSMFQRLSPLLCFSAYALCKLLVCFGDRIALVSSCFCLLARSLVLLPMLSAPALLHTVNAYSECIRRRRSKCP